MGTFEDGAAGRLGSGSFGVVRRVTHPATGKAMAVKELADSMVPEDQAKLMVHAGHAAARLRGLTRGGAA